MPSISNMASLWKIENKKKSLYCQIMALFIEKGQDSEVYHLSQQLAQAVEIILSPESSREKRVAATRVGT